MPSSAFSQIVAHQGGWDELLWIAGPLAIVAGLLWVANKRANALNATEDQAAGKTTSPPETLEEKRTK